jgi:hypothetical protein
MGLVHRLRYPGCVFCLMSRIRSSIHTIDVFLIYCILAFEMNVSPAEDYT